jgi:hypothetical protein
VLQIVFGWTGDQLHRFAVHGREHGIAYSGEASVTIRGGSGRAILACGAPNGSPTTTTSPPGDVLTCGSSRSCPPSRASAFRSVQVGAAGSPEDGGVWDFLENTQPRHVPAAAIRAAEILGLFPDNDEELTGFGEHRDEPAALVPRRPSCARSV